MARDCQRQCGGNIMSYTLTISVLGPLSVGTCRPSMQPAGCQRPAFYTVAATQGATGMSGGSNVCAEHLFPTVGHFLGLPERPVSRFLPR
jgi:hypothetical protein